MATENTSPPYDAGLALALAVVDSSTSPLLLLDGDLAVVAASSAFCRAFHVQRAGTVGRSIFAIGDGEWDTPQLRSLLKSTLSGAVDIEAYEMDLAASRSGDERQLVLNAHMLEYGDADHGRMLLTVADVTDARAAARLVDNTLREKAVLLQEVRHRVANSLQIIASVLLQNARMTQSEEIRSHLRDAHDRVMSVAALQQHLAASTLGDVELRQYFTKLCESIGASMIRDPEQIKLEVLSEEARVDADVSVSLGLIVTELVINALKHAFPGGGHGRIVVGYTTEDHDWTLSVSDDGVGMPKDPADAKAGLGTSIVQALSQQLDAAVSVHHAHPGTKVTIVHTEVVGAPAAKAEPAV
jgi:two-component sensor histidine kinase